MRFLFPVLLVAAAACAGGAPVQSVTPAEIDALEAEQTKFAQDPEVLTRIGIRFYEFHEYARAGEALSAALTLRPSFTAAVYAGLTHEAGGRFDEAEASYQTAGSMLITPAQRKELDRRVGSLAHVRLQSEARAAIAREAALASTPPEPGTIAVMPWTFLGEDPELRPLGVGIAHLILTDLSQISSLKLVERERVQVLLEEMELANVGRVDPRTAARAGRLLRAERVVHGIVRQTSDGIVLEAQVVRTDDGRIEATGRGGDRLDRLFSLEKGILFTLVEQMGIPLSPAELRAISERRTQDLQSFLALSRGLEAESRPSGSSASALARVASPVAPTELAAFAATLTSAIAVITPSTGGTVDRRTRLPVANPRLPEALRQDNPSRLAGLGDIIIIIPRP